jgi:peptide/nickel transport system permease protein
MTQIPQNVVEPPAEEPGALARGVPGRPLSPLSIAWRNLRKHRLAMVALVVLIIMYLAMLCDGFVAPYPYNAWDRQQAYHPAWNLHVVDAEGRFHLRPFVYVSHYEFDPYRNRIWREDTSRAYPLKLLVRGQTGTMLFGLLKTGVHLYGVQAPARLYLLGADWQGRDILSRIIFGGRVSLTIGIVGTAIAMIIGMIVGGISGYVGGAGDTVLQRICELIMLIPA